MKGLPFHVLRNAMEPVASAGSGRTRQYQPLTTAAIGMPMCLPRYSKFSAISVASERRI
jgi:hypothetical protein